MQSKHIAPMNKTTKRWLLDAGERVGMTVAYAGISQVVVELSGISQSWAPVMIVGLTALKTIIAKKVADPGSASVVSLPPEATPTPTDVSQAPSGGQGTA